MDPYKIFLVGCAAVIVIMAITLIISVWREYRSFNVAGDPEVGAQSSSHHSHRRINALRDDTW